MRAYRSTAGGLALALGIGLAAAAATALPAAAQPWGRYGGGGYYYDGPPPYRGYAYGPPVYDEPDGPPPGVRGDYRPDDYAPPAPPPRRARAPVPRAPVPLARIEEEVAAAGLRLIAKPRHNGHIYLAVAEDRRGRRRRLIFDAYAGTLIENSALPTPKHVVPRRLPSQSMKVPTDSSTKDKPVPPPAEARARMKDPLAIPGTPATPPDAPAAPAAPK